MRCDATVYVIRASGCLCICLRIGERQGFPLGDGDDVVVDRKRMSSVRVGTGECPQKSKGG